MDVTEKCIQIGDIQTRAYAHMPKTRLNQNNCQLMLLNTYYESQNGIEQEASIPVDKASYLFLAGLPMLLSP